MSKLAILGGKRVGGLAVPEWPIFDESENASLQKVLRSGKWGYLGGEEQEFEKRFAEFCGVEHAIAVPNGTLSLRLALEALEIGPGDEVIVPGFTWQATAASVLDVNATPILVDIDPDTYCISPDQVRASITGRTRCIIPVHLYCRIANLDEILAIAKEHNIFVIEDCAHQHGSKWRGTAVGGIGDIGSFSLQGSKLLTAGEGGVLTTNNGHLAERLHSLKNCGKPMRAGAQTVQSGNYRMTEFQAAVLNRQLERLPEQNAIREENALYLERLLADVGGLNPLQRYPETSFQAYYAWVLRFDSSMWNGITRSVFESCLQEELSHSVPQLTPLYRPLNDSPLYRPHSKKTHNLSKDYWEAIDPARFNLPNAWRAYEHEAIAFHHPFLLMSRVDCDRFIEAVLKIEADKDQLSSQKKFHSIV